MDLSELLERADASRARLADARREIGDDIVWYRYDILANLTHLDRLLHGENRELGRLAAGLPVADIGAADGDLAFMLEEVWGWEIDLIDNGPTNQNGLEGARALRDHLGSKIRIDDIDLDTQFRLPRDHYGLVLLLGILYHLENPFYVLKELSKHADHALLSTRVARFAGEFRTPIADLAVAYLVGPTETNNDATNHWMFSPAGLQRTVERAGWWVLERTSVGDVTASDPSSLEHDERMLMLLRSQRLGPAPTRVVQQDSAVGEERTRQLHETRGALAEAVSTLTAELTLRQAELTLRQAELTQRQEENYGLREHIAALEAEVRKQQQHAEMVQSQLIALKNTKAVRWSAGPRRLVYLLRQRH
jgi:hypothetical protein